ncbi:hypothetical protein [Brevundimonas sp. Root1279]|uniref:hypothetical protein n=1 Tax=Brevundimonas sp. Root1279 TaxID=1736443 RepID=UPI0012E352F9|nr:hypothetical protein [Brevundimonas sp. Root1279]
MVDVMRASFAIAFGLLGTLLVGCSDSEPSELREAHSAESKVEYASSGTVFDLAPAERQALERRAKLGDGEASFRLSQFYGLAAGVDGQTDADLVNGDDAVQQLRWLELGARQGHEVAEFNLAVVLAQSRRDCPRARALMTVINSESPDPGRRKSAGYWLQDDSFDCDRHAPKTR